MKKLPSKNKDSSAKDAISKTQLIPLAERAKGGDLTVLPELREVLSQNPELWRSIGDGAWRAEQCWIKLMAGDNKDFGEAIRQEQKALRDELLQATASTRLERVQIDRIALDMLQLSAFEADLARATTSGDSKAVKRLADQVHRAHGRLMASLRTLQVVRRIVCESPLADSKPSLLLPVRRNVDDDDDDDSCEADHRKPRGRKPVWVDTDSDFEDDEDDDDYFDEDDFEDDGFIEEVDVREPAAENDASGSINPAFLKSSHSLPPDEMPE